MGRGRGWWDRDVLSDSGSKFFEPEDFGAPGVCSGSVWILTWRNFYSRSDI